MIDDGSHAAGAAPIVSLADYRARRTPGGISMGNLPGAARARWFAPQDGRCGSDQDCTPDRLCVDGRCI